MGVTSAENRAVPSPTFSVVLPTRGATGVLCDALMSIQAQTVTDWECIVVVDGGDPPPIPCDERIRIEVRAVNGGAGAARNTGMARASGAYVTFLDDDDTWLPERLELAAEALDRAPVSVCYGLSDGVVAWKGAWEGDVADTILDVKQPSVNGLAVRRDVLVPFDERFRGAEDVEWLLRLAQRAEFTTVPRPGFVRRTTETPGLESRARLAGVRLLLDVHADYFATHRRAAARCWAYYAEMAHHSGLRRQAVLAYARALRHQPSSGLARAGLRAVRNAEPGD